MLGKTEVPYFVDFSAHSSIFKKLTVKHISSFTPQQQNCHSRHCSSCNFLLSERSISTEFNCSDLQLLDLPATLSFQVSLLFFPSLFLLDLYHFPFESDSVRYWVSSGKSQILLTLRKISGCWIHSAHHRRVSLKVPFDSAEWIRNSNHGACKPRDYSHWEQHFMGKNCSLCYNPCNVFYVFQTTLFLDS